MVERDGLVAIKYFQTIGQRVKIGGDEYFFDVKRNICLAWVKKDHVAQVLDITRTCCGGNKTHPYRLANEQQVRIWMGESER